LFVGCGVVGGGVGWGGGGGGWVREHFAVLPKKFHPLL